jgi:PilX N-terminal
MEVGEGDLMSMRKWFSKGFSSILAMIFVALFSVLAISFTAMSNINVQMSRNHRDLSAAQAAAESGLEYMDYYIINYIDNQAPKTSNNIVDDTDSSIVYHDFTSFLREQMSSSVLPVNQSIGEPVTFSNDGRTGLEVAIPLISFSSDNRAGFSLTIRQYNDDPQTLNIVSTGTMAGVSREVSINYSMVKDTQMLQFAVASKSPIEITDNTTIGTGVYSDWENTGIAPPVTLASISTIDGSVNTVSSSDDFTDAGYALEDKLQGTYEDLNYDQPKIEIPSAADFDTSMYAKDVSVLSAGHTTNTKEYFPHAPGDYEQPIVGSIELNRTVYDGVTISDKRAISGNALFRNCIFEGIFYIGTTTGIGTNNIRFEDCTFNGPIITGVPPKFGIEDWKKNALYFTGDSTFNNTEMEEATILAPNYNVDIGNTSSESVITGIILGGVVDIRGTATIDGSIISMADPMELGDQAHLLDTNIGISEEGNHTINISPSPDRMLPIGIKTKVLMVRDGDTYIEL